MPWERHKAASARVIPIILRPTDWKTASFARLQALPKDGHPITRWPDRDEAFLDVVRGLRRVIGEIQIRARPEVGVDEDHAALALLEGQVRPQNEPAFPGGVSGAVAPMASPYPPEEGLDAGKLKLIYRQRQPKPRRPLTGPLPNDLRRPLASLTGQSPRPLSDYDKLLLRFVAKYNKRPIKDFEMEVEMEARVEWPAVKTQHHLDNLRDAELLESARVPGSGFVGGATYGWRLSKKGRAFWVEHCQQEPAIPPVKVYRCEHCNKEVTREAITAKENATGHILYDECPSCGEPTPTPPLGLLGDP